MNEDKICFITCVSDEEKYQKMLGYLANLEVPAGLEAEVVTIREVGSMAAAYNKGMQESDAKYKVYIKQDTLITNKYFIRDVIRIFSDDESIGMIGVAGTEVIPTSAIYQQALKRTGKMKDINSWKILSWKNPDKAYEKVQAIDEFLIVTQYDIPWRDDLFRGEYFYDLAQSIEFTRQGYSLVVARQTEPWCIGNCSDFKRNASYEKDRNLFLDEYSKDVFPLVSILMPTHNRPELFKIALQSALNQTYRNIEIIISDNSENEETAELIKIYLNDCRISYARNPGFNCSQNWLWGLEHFQGEYFNYLLDDDIYHLDKISAMINFYLNDKDIGFVTSYRQPIDINGDFLKDTNDTKKICINTMIFDGKVIGKALVTSLTNFVGEVTTVLLHKSTQEIVRRNFNTCGTPIVDVLIWLELCQKGKVVYIVDTLSYFRYHAGQLQNDLNSTIYGVLSWMDLIHYYYATEKISIDDKEYKMLLFICMRELCRHSTTIYQENKYNDEVLKKQITIMQQYIKYALKKIEDIGK